VKRTLLVGLLVLRFASPAPAAALQTAPHAPVEVAARIAPDTVRIGEPFVVTLRIRAPKDAAVTFPAGPDSGGAAEALDPRGLSSTSDTTSSEYTATYRLAAWDMGHQAVVFAPAVVRRGGADETVPFGDLTILVQPTTPGDAAHRVPRAARALFALPRVWWPAWKIAVAVLAPLLLLWLIARWWRRRPGHDVPGTDPYTVGMRDFEALDGLGLLDAGEPGRYIALATGITRTYLVRRLAPASMAFTSAELEAALADDRRVPHARLDVLLAESDRVKFARDALSAAEARALGADARRMLEEVEQRVIAAETAAAAAVAANAGPASPPAPGPPGHRSSDSGTRGQAA
jgi:hypothetical protein